MQTTILNGTDRLALIGYVLVAVLLLGSAYRAGAGEEFSAVFLVGMGVALSLFVLAE